MNFGKVMTAMVTIFDKNGELDENENKKIIKKLCKEGTETIVIAGSTGEGPTLLLTEKIKLAKWAIEHKNPETKVIVNVGTNNTNETIEIVKVMQGIQGVDGLMVVCPYYNKPSQEGMYQHFNKINEISELPLLVYHIPGRTSVTLDLNTFKKIVDLDKVKMVKESSGDLMKTGALIDYIKEKKLLVDVYSGDDPTILPYMSMGAKGVISVAAHLKGKEIKNMIDLFESGNITEAAKEQRKLNLFVEKLFPSFAPNPVALKYFLSKEGYGTEEVRLPLTKMTDEEKEILVN
jgi:4-hydroxy-tetrahydrodipicolinate synthase